jgi:hypothetical protein
MPIRQQMPKNNKVEKVMREFKEGSLKSSTGGKVTDRKQPPPSPARFVTVVEPLQLLR